jgi:FTR1 family protein
MVQSFVITLREGLEAALILGIILTYLHKTQQGWLRKHVYLGLTFAILFSILGAIAFQLIQVNEEAYEGVIMLTAAVFVASMLFWMKRKAKGLRGKIESQIDQLTTTKGKTGLGILLFTFLMVFREGVETVLFLSAVSFTTTALLSFLGGLLGIALAATFGVLFVKGSVRVNLKKFFSITSAVLLVIVVQLVINGLHELFEAGWLPGGEREMALVGPIVRNDSLFLVVVLLLPLIMLLTVKGQPASVPDSESTSLSLTAAQRRKLLWQAKRESLWRMLAGTATVVIAMVITASHLYSSIPKELSPAHPVSAIDGVIRIPTSSLQLGLLHRFVYDLEGVPVRFLLMKQKEDEIKSAMDACLLCGDKGYYQDKNKDSVICRNCTAEIYVPTLGQGGGCNPLPLTSQLSSNEVIIKVSDLENNSYFFKK